MSLISVKAANGLRVPLEGNPHEYIGQEPVQVDGESLYYRRLLADGDLLPVSGRLKTPKSQGASHGD
ncbi:DUF2635 domain-containing protein [Bergeriella denitrificans]|uniref:DUF2635 domain-containing protein n=1 Tax=Bergeriella denitrificans TaxID=494 RepID=A0A378UDW7_BERDE|nr:DUF2635 domain-containing protein [Bergeriella denitrificans]STZ75566.1 Uncharacterised protein [Bergeriella denitrificans]